MTTGTVALDAGGVPGTRPVRLGRVDYVNVLPVYLGLEREGTSCDIVRGVPTELNRSLDARRIDCAPVSAIELARHAGRYALLPSISISSVGAVGSSMLFSRVPPERLDGCSVALTTHSAASLGFFSVLCARRWGVRVRGVAAEPDLDAMLATHDAAVLIGNPAIRAVARARRREDVVVTDLGEAWHEMTGLPAVFAVWALWSDCVADQRDAVALLRSELERGRRWGLDPRHRAELDAAGAADLELDLATVHDYFDLQDYALTADHERSLLLYFENLAALDLAPALRTLEFAT